MPPLLKAIGHVLLLLVFWMALGWVLWRTLKKTPDAGRLISKWVITGVLAAIGWVIIPKLGDATLLFAIFFAALAAIIWVPSILGAIAKPVTDVFDGGDAEFEAQPVYSRATFLRGQGKSREAIDEVRQQLEQFPNDFTGQMLLAAIAAEDLKDLPAADVAVQRILNQPDRKPAQVVGALNSMADWHLKFGQDTDSARAALEKIAERFPNSQFSQAASHRIAHLASTDQLMASHERPTIALKSFTRNIGAQVGSSPDIKPKLEDPAERAAHYVAHLQKHPLDAEARENLATIYAEHYQRIDLAAIELDQLILQPNHPSKQVVHWLNLLADFQVKLGNDAVSAERTIRRIEEMFPNTAYASQASSRLQFLRLETKRNEKSQAVKLGSYEKDLGLKKN